MTDSEIRDNQKNETTTPRESSIIWRLSFVGIVGNVALLAFKFFAGIVGNSGAMLSDAVHSLSDAFTTVVAYVGVVLSKRAADDEHPYGHERLECISALLLGLILFITGALIGKAGMENILSGNYAELAVPRPIALVAAVVSILTKEAMYQYTKHYAKILNSAAFMADAWHHRSDAFSSIGSLIGIGGAMMGYVVLDSVASVVICLIILKVAVDTMKNAINQMLDTSCGKNYERKLEDFISAQDGVVKVDMLHSRMFGSKIYIDLEIEVDGHKSLCEAHDIAERVHEKVEKSFPNIKHVMIHVNPTKEAGGHTH